MFSNALMMRTLELRKPSPSLKPNISMTLPPRFCKESVLMEE